MLYQFSSTDSAMEAGYIVGLKTEKEKNPAQTPLKQQLNLEVFPRLILVQFAVYFEHTCYSVCRATGQIKFFSI